MRGATPSLPTIGCSPIQAWADAPISPAECRFGLVAALQKLTPAVEGNRSKFQDVAAVTKQLQSILCGAAIPSGHGAPVPSVT